MNNLEKDFVPYSESMELKELGFDEPCIKQWTYTPELIFCTSIWGHPKLKTNKESHSDSGGDCISAPTFSQAFRWFREKYILFSGVLSEYSYGGEIHAYHINGKRQENISKGNFTTYEEAELACLRKLIEIVKQK